MDHIVWSYRTYCDHTVDRTTVHSVVHIPIGCLELPAPLVFLLFVLFFINPLLTERLLSIYILTYFIRARRTVCEAVWQARTYRTHQVCIASTAVNRVIG